MNENEIFLENIKGQIDERFFSPSLLNYLQEYLTIEKVRLYNNQFVINTFIPPAPGLAFDRFLQTFFGDQNGSKIQSVDLALTNGCIFHCWHCYNANRVLQDLPTKTLKKIVRNLQDLGAIVINFTGGEPCLRHDLVEICGELREDSCGILAITGYGFTEPLAKRLKQTRVYSISISLDSADEKEHDAGRGLKGAYRVALQGIEMAKKYGFYTYTCAVPTKKLLKEENFYKLVELNKQLEVNEMQLIEPAPAGRLSSAKLDFGEEEFKKITHYMKTINQNCNGFAITSFAHMESPEFFGCGAGHSHIYVDGSGEVSPCNMIPISYGNAAKEELSTIISRMQRDFRKPCQNCLLYLLKDFFSTNCKGTQPVSYRQIPPIPFPDDQKLPKFFQIAWDKEEDASGIEEIIRGYNNASTTYDDYWLTVASEPIDMLFQKLKLDSGGSCVDCGCGTGYTTMRCANKVGGEGKVLGIDLSPKMIQKAKTRMKKLRYSHVKFMNGDVLKLLESLPASSFDGVVMTWLIGYVGCWEIFPLVKRILKPGGKIGFVAHMDRSPRIPIEVFEEIIMKEPESLEKNILLKFPKDVGEVKDQLKSAGFRNPWLYQGTFNFICHTGLEVYDHIMKSGAGTTFYYSLNPSARNRLSQEFITRINKRFQGQKEICIDHDYVVGIADASNHKKSSENHHA